MGFKALDFCGLMGVKFASHLGFPWHHTSEKVASHKPLTSFIAPLRI